MAGNGWKMARNGWNWMEWLEMSGNGVKRMEMAGNGWTWMTMAGNGLNG